VAFRTHKVITFVLALAGLATAALAQSTTGSISGLVVDQSKSVLPGVTIAVTNVETGVQRSLVTDESGRYRALNIPPGRYRVRGELSGFQAVETAEVIVQIGRDVPVDLTMSVGQVSESVTVTGQSSLVDLSAAVVGGVVTTQQIAELPLNGRSFMQLATLQPGVSVSRSTGRDFTGGFGGTQISIAGARPEQTGYLLEGTNIGDIADKAPSSVAGVLLGVDTVQEFSVQTHGYSAEFGRAAGGIISAVTKSGTNQFRGTVFEFHRNSAFDAAGYFDDGTPPEFRRNQFGGTLGGPILRNKLFFFGSYEGLRERLGTTRFARVPNADAHRGFLPAPGGGLRNVGVHPAIRPYLDLLYPIPTGHDFGDGTAEFAYAPTEPTNENFFVGKVDWAASPNDNLLVRVSSDKSNNQVWVDGAGPNSTDITQTDTRYTTTQWQRLFTSRVLNELRGAVNRTARDITPTSLVDVPRNLYFANEPYFGYIEVPGLLATVGNPDDAAKYVQNLYQVSDTFAANLGRHTWKAGFDFQRYHFDGFSESRRGGAFRFRTLEEMLRLNRSATAQADRFTGVLPGTDTDRHMRQNYAAVFVHDDFRMADTLSLSLGVRYEFVTTPEELNGKVAGLLRLEDLESGPRGITPGSPMFDNPSKRMGWAPRLGASWTPFGDRTTIRGGAGMFYQPLTVSFYRGTTFRLYPYFAGVDIRQPAVFGPAMAQLLASPTVSASVQRRSEFIFHDTKQPYAVQWYVNAQHELAGSFVAEVGYMGSKGENLPFYGDPNSTPSEYVDGVKRVVPGAQLRYPSWGRIRTRRTGADSNYHGMTLSLQRRFQDGLQFQANYTYSRSTDTWSGGQQGSSDFQGAAGSAVDWWDIEFERGRSSFDVPHNVVFNAVYMLPFGQNLTGVAGALARGWQIGGIAMMSSGMPFHPRIGFDRAGDRQSDTDMQRPSWAAGRDAGSAITGRVDQWFDPTAFVLPAAGTFGNVRRNVLRGPNLRVVDFSTFKNQQAGPVMLQFRVEIFNLFNRANFATPGNPVLFAADGTRVPGSGRITALTTPPRQLQFGVKMLF
jgi:hypothetical protein